MQAFVLDSRGVAEALASGSIAEGAKATAGAAKPAPDSREDVIYIKPGARAHVYRTAICGGGLAYDVYIPEEDVHIPKHETVERVLYSHAARTGIQRYIRYKFATAPAEQQRMPKGLDRWRAWCEHEKRAQRREYRIGLAAFPELARADTGDRLPFIARNLGVEPETSACVVLSLAGALEDCATET